MKRLKWACYFTNISMAVAGNLPPILVLTFRSMYGVSYSLLGLLVLVNFITQLGIDLVFSFFSHRFNITKTVRFIPVLTVVGLVVYALWPVLLPQAAYVGLVVGTVLFSVSAGLGEVLISPVIAALPSDDPDREMSRLHSVYAWGAVGVVLLSTLFILVFGGRNWPWVAIAFAAVPLTSAILFSRAQIPHLDTPEKASGALQLLKNSGVWLCVAGIFLGGASELVMAQWASGYLEQSMGIPKVWGDVLGVALFSVMLGMGRTLYGKFGRNIEKVLLAGGIGASVCYLTAALCSIPVIGLIACALTGLCVSMLWPGSLTVSSERFPAGGVFIFALMAAGGDLGASVGPQLIGVITDAVLANPQTAHLGMRVGMLVAALFPLLSIPVYAKLYREKKK
ncbi:MAG: MFS transporter [Clostridia bacterium]|nr:MFS transporter [Clostridia bacterium]